MTASLFVQILVLATAVCGVLRFIDFWLWKPYRQEQEGLAAKQPAWLDNTAGMFYYLLAILVLRCFVAEVYVVPTGSLLPTVQLNDRLLVDKFSYGLRNPLTNNIVVPMGHPSRGDIVVFHYPPDPGQMYVKRLIGLPGDVVEYSDKTLRINGQRPFSQSDISSEQAQAQGLQERTEDLVTENGVLKQHRIWVQPDMEIDYVRQPAFRPTPHCKHEVQRMVCTVPAGQYFMMGDNRDNSSDSRVWGFVSEQQIVGKAHRVLFNTSQLSRIWQAL